MVQIPSKSSLPLCLGIALLVGPISVSDLRANCLAPDQQLASKAVSDFLNNPASLLQQSANAQGGAGLISAVRDLAASNQSTLPAIIALLKSANVEQQKAIGTGLGQAAGLCVKPDLNYANDIQLQVARSDSADAKTQYAAATGNRAIEFTGGGGGGFSGGASGGQTTPFSAAGAGGGGLQSFSANSVLGSSTNYFTSSISSAGSSTTIISPVVTLSR